MALVNSGTGAIEMPFVVVGEDYKVTFGQHSDFGAGPTDSYTPSGIRKAECESC